MRAINIIGAALLALGTAGCVNTALPPGTMVQAGPGAYAPPPPMPYYAPPPPRRCFFQDGPYGPERVCRRGYD